MFPTAVSLCTCRHSNEDFFESPRPSLAKEGSTFSPSPSSIVFTTPSVPLLGDRNLRKRGCNRPPVLGTATLYGWRTKAVYARLCGMGPPGCYGMTAGISAYVLYQIIQNANLNENYSSIDAMKLSKLSTRTTPAS